MSGELALGSIDADGQGQHELARRLEGLRRDGWKRERLHAAEPAGGHVPELLVLAHGRDIGRVGGNL